MRADAIVGLVRRLLTHEAAGSRDLEPLIEAAERVSDKLRAHLSRRIGQEGFRTLLARALALTTAQFPHLSAVRVGADGALIGLRAAQGRRTEGAWDRQAQEDSVEGAVALIAHLLGLLITFIGEELTLRILSSVWPDFALDGAADRETEKP